MKNLFYTGGPVFMSILSILLIVMMAWFIYHFAIGMNNQSANKEKVLCNLKYGRSIGLFAMITGILGQLIGLYMALTEIERAAEISPPIVWGGIKVSMISTLYGILIYLLALILWFSLSAVVEKRLERA
jgi:biopolymer transport protein ExbB/TolQ